VRGDLTQADFLLLTCGVMSTMCFKPSKNADWRRCLDLALDGVRTARSR
jgi:hypothetical protein